MKFKQRLISVGKSAWLVLIFGGVAFYLIRNFDQVMAHLDAVSAYRLLLAGAFLTVGRLLLVELSRWSVRVAGGAIGYERMFYINSISQLAKYLPGGIWHFVGRAGYYHTENLTPKQTTKAIIVENIWLVTSACCVGAFFIVAYAADAASGLLLLGLLAAWIGIQVLVVRLHGEGAILTEIIILLALQAVIWFLLGLSLWAIVPEASTPGLFALVIGAFCVSWAIGYLTLFAPSGLGVREGVMLALLAVAIAPAQVIVFVTLHRLIWVAVEVVLGVLARLFATGDESPTPESVPQ